MSIWFTSVLNNLWVDFFIFFIPFHYFFLLSVCLCSRLSLTPTHTSLTNTRMHENDGEEWPEIVRKGTRSCVYRALVSTHPFPQWSHWGRAQVKAYLKGLFNTEEEEGLHTRTAGKGGGGREMASQQAPHPPPQLFPQSRTVSLLSSSYRTSPLSFLHLLSHCACTCESTWGQATVGVEQRTGANGKGEVEEGREGGKRWE